jgi:hypothetical protein
VAVASQSWYWSGVPIDTQTSGNFRKYREVALSLNSQPLELPAPSFDVGKSWMVEPRGCRVLKSYWSRGGKIFYGAFGLIQLYKHPYGDTDAKFRCKMAWLVAARFRLKLEDASKA